MSSIFSITFTTTNGQTDKHIYVGEEKPVRIAAASEVSRYGFRGYDLELVGYNRYEAKKGDIIIVVGG